MIRTVFAKGLAVAVAALATLPLRAYAACDMKLLAAVDIEFNPNGGVLVPVQINGHDAWMVLNLASGMPMIGPTALAPMGLKPAAVPAASNLFSNGATIIQQVRVGSLRMGGANFTDWSLYVVPAQGQPLASYKDRPMVGILSAVFMNVVDLELDLAGRKMNLFKQTSCKGEQVYWGGEVASARLFSDPAGLLYFPMELEGKRVEASLNTSGRRSLLSEKVTRDFFGFQIDSPGVTPETVNSANGPVKRGLRQMNFSARGLTLAGVTVTIESNRGGPRCIPSSSRESGGIGFDGCSSLVPLELGTDVLAQLRIYVATKEKKVYITRAAPAPVPAGVPNAAGRNAPAADAADPAGAAPAAGAAAAAEPAPAPAR